MKKKNKKVPLLAKLFDPKMLLLDFARLTAWPALLFYRMKVVYENKNAKKFRKHTGIIASNHTDYFDCVALVATNKRTIHFLAKDELLKDILGAPNGSVLPSTLPMKLTVSFAFRR